MDYSELRSIVASCVEGPEQSVNFRLNMYKLTRKCEVLGLVPLFYKNNFTSKEITVEDIPLISEYCKGESLLWFDENKSFLTCIFIRQEDLDSELQNLLQNILRLRIDTNNNKRPFNHNRINHHCDCFYKESDDIIDIISNIVSKYPCYICFIAKAVTSQNILLNIRFKTNSVLSEIEKEANGELSHPARIEQDGKVTYFSDLSEAIETVDEGGVITLTSDISLKSDIEIDKSITIEGSEGNIYTISASDDFVKESEGGAFIKVHCGSTVTLKNLTINSGKKARGLYSDLGNLIVENCTIIGNKCDMYPGGAYITKSATATFIDCTIIGNEVGDDYVNDNMFYYSKDLWVGANAKCTLQNCKVGNVFVNANSYSIENKGWLIFDGSIIDTLFLEFADGFGADMIYKKGIIDRLLMMASDGETVIEYTDELEIDNTYTGGTIDINDIVVLSKSSTVCTNATRVYDPGR